jgi:PhnB protein
MQFTPYLNFNGRCAEAFRFYADVLGGEVVHLQTHGESPVRDHVPPEWYDKVLHVCLTIDGQLTLMGSDAPPNHYATPQGLHVAITVSDAEDAARLFNALADGGQVTMPFGRTFWSPGFGMVVDRFGTPWMVNTAEETARTATTSRPGAARSAR